MAPQISLVETQNIGFTFVNVRGLSQVRNSEPTVAVVIDEHTSFAGVVTTEDILEQMIGEIHDARDSRMQPFHRIDERRIVVSGTMEVDHFNEVFETTLQDEHHETVAGYLLGIIGRIPREGESI